MLAREAERGVDRLRAAAREHARVMPCGKPALAQPLDEPHAALGREGRHHVASPSRAPRATASATSRRPWPMFATMAPPAASRMRRPSAQDQEAAFGARDGQGGASARQERILARALRVHRSHSAPVPWIRP